MNRSVLLGFVLMLAGCGPVQNRVEGTVALDGQPLDRGFITFFPIDGKDSARGVEIHHGQYEISDMPTGQRKALITTTPNMEVVSSEGAPKLHLTAAAMTVTPRTQGNQTVVEIVGGRQTIDFTLQNPPRRSQP